MLESLLALQQIQSLNIYSECITFIIFAHLVVFFHPSEHNTAGQGRQAAQFLDSFSIGQPQY